MARGAVPVYSEYFNSQPHEEADDLRSQNATPAGHFNSQPHEEADGTMYTYGICTCHFNSQPHEEADDFHIKIISGEITFQLTASRRG